jgi:hypothetical protein
MTFISGFRAMLAAGAAAMSLSGCVALPIGTFDEATVTPGPVQVRQGFYFQNGEPLLLPGEAQRMNRILRELALRPQDEVILTFGATGSDELDYQRIAAMRGLIASNPARLSVIGPLEPAPAPDRPDVVLLQVRLFNRLLVTCPVNGVPIAEEGLNPQVPGYGCANAVNVAEMAAEKSDLIAPRQLKGSDAVTSVRAVERYRMGDVTIAPLETTTN